MNGTSAVNAVDVVLSPTKPTEEPTEEPTQAARETAVPPAKRVKQLTPFSLTDFKLTPRLQQWIDQSFQPMLIVCGEAGVGKTVFCKTLAQSFNWQLLVINHMEGLKNLTPQHQAILFDDPTFKDISPEQLLAFITTDDEKEIRVMHSTIDKPANLIQMMTINRESLIRVAHLFQQKQYARRLWIENLTESILIPPINVNVTINNTYTEHTQIYNNPDNIATNIDILSTLLDD